MSEQRLTNIRHKGNVYCIALSPDGSRIVSGDSAGTTALWDAKTGKSFWEVTGGVISCAAFSPDGAKVVVGEAETVRVIDAETGRLIQVVGEHEGDVFGVAFSPDGSRIVSGAFDSTVRIWDMNTGKLLQIFLEEHGGPTNTVSFSPDGSRVVSGSYDAKLRLWDADTGQKILVLEGHQSFVYGVAFSTDGTHIASASDDCTVRIWDAQTGEPIRIFEGHESSVDCIAFSPDGSRIASGDNSTVRIWDVNSGRPIQILEGHKGGVRSCGFISNRISWSGTGSGTVGFWNVEDSIPAKTYIQYTNAKVLLVGDSGAGKTGLSNSLVNGKFRESESSTIGAWATHLPLKAESDEAIQKEVWLWDFAGQADQRLVHQLYMDGSAAVVLVFNADQRDPVPGLRIWKRALDQTLQAEPAYFLVAARTDAGRQFDQESLRRYAEDNRCIYFETSALSGKNIAELRQSILDRIDWEKIVHRSTPAAYKEINDAILHLRDEKVVLLSLDALKERLRPRIDPGIDLDKDILSVLNLLEGPGLVKCLEFGRYVLLRPEWINKYAQTVLRTIRADDQNLGSIEADQIRQARLIFNTPADGDEAKADRLGADDEAIVLRAMEDALLDRGLCLRVEDRLVFPSHCGIERQNYPYQPLVNVSYRFEGYLDDAYATLVTRLALSGAFELKSLWRDAADFSVPEGEHTLGVRLIREPNGDGVIELYRDRDLNAKMEVVFAAFVHQHLKKGQKRGDEVVRQRHHICPQCKTPVLHFDKVMKRLQSDGRKAKIICVDCERSIPLWDEMEDLFADDRLRAEVMKLEEAVRVELDSRRKGELLVNETLARIHQADQKGEPVGGANDEGVDIRMEFTKRETNRRGNEVSAGTGRWMALQTKSGNSYLRERKRDGVETFQIEEKWADYWAKQECPVMLVIGTFPDERSRGQDRFDRVRWMEVGNFCRREINADRKITQIEFAGEDVTTDSILKWRDDVLGGKWVRVPLDSE